MCDCALSVSFSVKGTASPYKKYVGLSVLLTACAWLVSLGGLASMQDEVKGDLPQVLGATGFSAGILPASRIYSYYWFIVALELIVLLAAAYVLGTGYWVARPVVVGLFTIATLLYINFTNAFMDFQSIDALNEAGAPGRDRLRTLLAGCIMTAALNGISLVAFGYEGEVSKEPHVTLTQAA